MLSKAIDEITPQDIAELCAHGGEYESTTLEFKRELPGRDGRPDPWIDGRDFSSYARDRLFREIIAFANAQGGTLVLGIEETEDEPPRAQRIVPVPRVHDLATRLLEAARACIEPPLTSLLVCGLITDGADGGVIVFRTVASPFGPHRVASDGHAFIRRGTSSVKMTMREIQDLTLDLARGTDRLDRLFQERAAAFTQWFRYSNLIEKAGLRITAIPLSGLPRPIRVTEQGDVPYENRYNAQADESQYQLVLPDRGIRSRPILRGARLLSQDDTYALQVDVLDSGIIDLWMWKSREQNVHLYIGWILAAYLAVLRLGDWVRRVVLAPEWEFAVELELGGLAAAHIPDTIRSLGAIEIGDLSEGPFRETYSISKLPLHFPRMASRSRADEEDLLNLVWADLINASGHRLVRPRMTLV